MLNCLQQRMNYIIGYISAYKQKIEMANKKGLLDSAKMFELFAEQICKLYYGMDFRNLNNICNLVAPNDFISFIFLSSMFRKPL